MKQRCVLHEKYYYIEWMWRIYSVNYRNILVKISSLIFYVFFYFGELFETLWIELVYLFFIQVYKIYTKKYFFNFYTISK